MVTACVRLAVAILAALLVAPAAVAAQVEVSARVEPTRVAVGDPAELVVEVVADGVRASIDEPDLPPLDGLEIVGTARESGVRLVGTRVTRHATWRYRLVATRPGTIRIGPVAVDVEGRTLTTEPVTVFVAAPAGPGERSLAGREGGPPPVFATTRVDRQEAFVGQQLTLTFAFYHDPRVALAESPDYDPPETTGFWRVELDPEPRASTERIGDRVYHVQRFRYALFPLRPGRHVIGPAKVRVTEPDPGRWWRAGRPRTIETPELEVVARPLPEDAPAGFDGAVGRYALSGGLATRQATAGVPVPLEVTVQGTGNPTAVPPPDLPDWPDVAVGTPGVDAETAVAGGAVRGRKTFRWLLVPDVAGRLDLGVARLPYFDPASGTYAIDSLRLGEIEVAAAPAAGTAASAREESAGPTLWPARAPRAPAPRGLADEPWTWAGLAAPWLAWLAVLGIARVRRRARGSAGPSSWDRLARARRALVEGREGGAVEARRALDGLLAGRWGARADAADPALRRRRMAESGVPDPVADAAEDARARLAALAYGAGSTAAAVEALERLEDVLGRAPRRRGGGAALGVALLLAAAAPAGAQDDAVARWEVANRAYRAGAFAAAAEAYRDLLAEAPDARLEANLAAALWRAGERGAAVLHYRRALRLDPRAGAVRADLARLRAALGDPPIVAGPPAPLDRVRLDELLLALLVLGGAGALALAGGRRLRPVATGLVALFVLVAGAAALHGAAGEGARAIALAEAPVAARPGGAIVARIPEGGEVEVLERTPDGWRVRAAGLPAGWVAPGKLAPLD